MKPKFIVNQSNFLENTMTHIITVDGPSGAGKGTLCYRLAEHFGYRLLDSGALYRIVGLLAYQQGLLTGLTNEQKIAQMVADLALSFHPNPSTKMVDIVIDGQVLTEDIRNETVGGYASIVAAMPSVRAMLLELQKKMGNQGLVADGRDMGTVIFPQATAKIFLTASADARATRRVVQLKQLGNMADYTKILADIQARDERDENRAIAPSRPAPDALVLDSSQMSSDEVYETVLKFCYKKGVIFAE